MVNFVNPDSLGSLQVRMCGAHRTCASRWSLRCRACFPDQRVCSGFGCCFPHEALRSHLMCPPPPHTHTLCVSPHLRQAFERVLAAPINKSRERGASDKERELGEKRSA